MRAKIRRYDSKGRMYRALELRGRTVAAITIYRLPGDVWGFLTIWGRTWRLPIWA